MTKSDDCEEVNIGALFNYEGMASSKIQVVFFLQFPQPCLSTFCFSNTGSLINIKKKWKY